MKIAFSIPGFSNIQPTMALHGGLSPSGADPGTGTKTVAVFVALIIIIGILFAFWNILWGGLQIIFSRGIKDKIKNARERVLYGILGLVLMLFSLFFVQILGAALGFNLIP
jgi:hypothetical protein